VISRRARSPARRRHARGWAALPVAGVLGGAGLAGVAALNLTGAFPSRHIDTGTVPLDAGTVPLAGSVAIPAPTAAASPAVVPARGPPALAGGVPQRLQLPASGIDATVLPVRVSPRGELGVPTNVSRLGWWAAGPLPGTPVGTCGPAPRAPALR